MKSFTIQKKYICNFIGMSCDVTSKHPDCKNCSLYKDWKKSKLTIGEFYKKLCGRDQYE